MKTIILALTLTITTSISYLAHSSEEEQKACTYENGEKAKSTLYCATTQELDAKYPEENNYYIKHTVKKHNLGRATQDTVARHEASYELLVKVSGINNPSYINGSLGRFIKIYHDYNEKGDLFVIYKTKKEDVSIDEVRI